MVTVPVARDPACHLFAPIRRLRLRYGLLDQRAHAGGEILLTKVDRGKPRDDRGPERGLRRGTPLGDVPGPGLRRVTAGDPWPAELGRALPRVGQCLETLRL